MLLITLVLIAVALTTTMFATRQSMLGFACALFWIMVGGQAYTLSTGAWADIYFYLFFGAGFGMTTFTALAAYGLREKRDTIAEDEMEEEGSGEGAVIDEPDSVGKMFGDKDEEKLELSAWPKRVRRRAANRRRKYTWK